MRSPKLDANWRAENEFSPVPVPSQFWCLNSILFFRSVEVEWWYKGRGNPKLGANWRTENEFWVRHSFDTRERWSPESGAHWCTENYFSTLQVPSKFCYVNSIPPFGEVEVQLWYKDKGNLKLGANTHTEKTSHLYKPQANSACLSLCLYGFSQPLSKSVGQSVSQ